MSKKFLSKLAIVIPAYKKNFLAKTLDSLVKQTNQSFSVYIGNDAGDNGIEEIVKQYQSSLDIYYHYFEDNFGRTSLVKQWERCFTLIKNEDWIWLLPDDDYADPQCVEYFYDQLHKSDFDLFRFNVHFVTACETIFKTNAMLPDVQSSFESLMEKLSFSRPSTVAEFIFRKEKFDNIGFAEIPMAWGTDDMLWFLLGWYKGIRGTNNASVYLRQSNFNISNNYIDLAAEKIAANFIFLEQLLKSAPFRKEISDKRKRIQFNKISLEYILYNLQDFHLKLSINKMFKYAVKANKIWGGGVATNIRRFYFNNKRITLKGSYERK